jgi:hypothetical protein
MSKATEMVEKLRTLNKDDLRLRWSTLFGKSPPPALTKDLLGRMIAWRIQEKFYGGHDKATLKLLDGLARDKVAKPAIEPRLRPGTVLMREHGGVRRTVTVTPDGFVWQNRTYPSLSSVARAITGTSWNGRRFFGLRMKRKPIGGRPANDAAGTKKAAPLRHLHPQVHRA